MGTEGLRCRIRWMQVSTGDEGNFETADDLLLRRLGSSDAADTVGGLVGARDHQQRQQASDDPCRRKGASMAAATRCEASIGCAACGLWDMV